MAWVVPRTWTTGEIVTAAMLNGVRDALNDLDRRTSPVGAEVDADQTTASTSYVAIATAGPAVTVTVGSTGKATCEIFDRQYNNTSGGASHMGYDITGATTRAAEDKRSLTFFSAAVNAEIRHGGSFLDVGLNAGSTTFTSKYRAGLAGSAGFDDRRLLVTPLGS